MCTRSQQFYNVLQHNTATVFARLMQTKVQVQKNSRADHKHETTGQVSVICLRIVYATIKVCIIKPEQNNAVAVIYLFYRSDIFFI